MLLGAGAIAGQLLLTYYIDRSERQRRPAGSRPAASKGSAGNALGMVLRTRYLLLMGLTLMTVNLVNTTGEYILGVASGRTRLPR